MRLPNDVEVPHSTCHVVTARFGVIRALRRAVVAVFSTVVRRAIVGTVGLTGAGAVLTVWSAPSTPPATSR